MPNPIIQVFGFLPWLALFRFLSRRLRAFFDMLAPRFDSIRGLTMPFSHARQRLSRRLWLNRHYHGNTCRTAR